MLSGQSYPHSFVKNHESIDMALQKSFNIDHHHYYYHNWNLNHYAGFVVDFHFNWVSKVMWNFYCISLFGDVEDTRHHLN